jgi:5,10-methylene-tetrahydrofolate dehydrogenase/methenyl tetrahydrofolate cyclohydrolase
LAAGKSYQIRVKRTVANPPILSTNQVKAYLQQTPLPNRSDLALFAADVDRSGEVDATDVLHIERFINGVTPSMPGGIWRILPSYNIDANNNFVGLNAPSPLKNLVANVTNFDFIVVTLGDMSLNRCN